MENFICLDVAKAQQDSDSFGLRMGQPSWSSNSEL